MGDKTGIEWTDATWNPIRGCSRVSAGCDNCYAMRQAHRMNHPGGAYEGLTRVGKRGVDWTGEVRLVREQLDAPLRWTRPRRVFVNSMSDLFHPSLDFQAIAAVFGVMAASPRHTFQVLTKRPSIANKFFAWLAAQDSSPDCAAQRAAYHALPDENEFQLHPVKGTLKSYPWPLPNVWLGVSVEDQPSADERIPLLLETPAAVRFISAEPLLERIDLRHLQPKDPPTEIDALAGTHGVLRPHGGTCNRLDWVIVGGESGPGSRPILPGWVSVVRDQCVETGVPFFFKQWGGIDKKAAGRFLDDREWLEMPGATA